ncbi:S-adenosyl-L-methionine-dependent methyltransferase [Xylariales sp. AK1849]|nr:S-adenosyl-L-methionine-dependent methyltransferase [Xylariales sp. AK1849]
MFRIGSGGKLPSAPIENPREVLDVAIGTGNWAVEFTQEHPEAQVLGTDLLPTYTARVTPPNVSFEICDAEDECAFNRKFDFIHMRAVLTCFRDPRLVIASAIEALGSGGYIELRDACMPFRCLTPRPGDCALRQ